MFSSHLHVSSLCSHGKNSIILELCSVELNLIFIMISRISFKKSDGETGPLKVTDAVQNDAPAITSGSGFFVFL